MNHLIDFGLLVVILQRIIAIVSEVWDIIRAK